MYGSNIILPSRMLSFDSALSAYNSIKPIRGRSEDTRPLARRANDNLTIRQDETTGDIVVQLYQTDIIRYINDGDGYNNPIRLTPYPSVLTNRTVRSILWPHVYLSWVSRLHPFPDHITQVGGRFYNTPEFAMVQPRKRGWVLTGGDKPFELPRVNRREAKQALHDTGFYRFQTWLNTVIRIGADPRSEWGRRSRRSYARRSYEWSPREVMKYLTAGEEGWSEIAGRMSRIGDVQSELSSLRRAVYKSELCYDTEIIPYFNSYSEMKAAFNRVRNAG